MKLTSASVSMAAVAVLAAGIALWPANAQPAGDKPALQPPAGEPARPNGPRGGQPQSPWREKLRDELRDHPSLGRALLSLHEAKDYLETVQGDLGGHKKATIESIDNSIKQITEAIKFDPKRESPAGDGKGGGRPGRRPGGGGGGGGGDRPAGDTPPATPAPKP